VPTSDWTHEFDEARALEEAPRLSSLTKWRHVPGVVTHVFTHFPLELVVYGMQVPSRTKTPAGMRWVALGDVAREALPNVMRKVVAHALGGVVERKKRRRINAESG
jgi:A/G-specific adenine glycosylase